MEHRIELCPNCGPMVVCGECGNNTCNGTHGTVNEINCHRCASAYELAEQLDRVLSTRTPSAAEQAMRKALERIARVFNEEELDSKTDIARNALDPSYPLPSEMMAHATDASVEGDESHKMKCQHGIEFPMRCVLCEWMRRGFNAALEEAAKVAVKWAVHEVCVENYNSILHVCRDCKRAMDIAAAIRARKKETGHHEPS